MPNKYCCDNYAQIGDIVEVVDNRKPTGGRVSLNLGNCCRVIRLGPSGRSVIISDGERDYQSFRFKLIERHPVKPPVVVRDPRYRVIREDYG